MNIAVQKRSKTRRLYAALIVVLLAFSGAVLSPAGKASAADQILSQYIDVGSIGHETVSSTSFRVKYFLLKDIPATDFISVSWGYSSATRDPARKDTQWLHGKKGDLVSITLKGVPAGVIMPVRAVAAINLPSVYESVSAFHAMGPSSWGWSTRVVTPAEAVANAVAVHVPGAIMTFVPQTRAVKIVGAAILSWSIFSDIQQTITGDFGTCPKLATSQYIITTTYMVLEGDTIDYRAIHRVYTSQYAYGAGEAPLCDVNSTILKVK